ncbi:MULTISPECIES: FimV domain-containing protein [unclassified Acinetobacter]|uniref:FimV/HubP-related protein n=1 Tax=unclassified Acinetobacter TaxID=196816 RepID=UPI001F4B34BC|nr:MULTISPECIES: FimV domain-containing protein [unclassified Acinetobacter]MCH7351033.1 FimV domain-containing protein [Acinetobacter sp. NIPH 2023]MCH7358594.1 FimV domain-containing protein [Acinetobacter sp. NIPH 2024]
MTVYNKLKIAILAIFSSQHLYAITLDPVQIQSAPGELLYAEMSFHQADANSKLDVSLATPEDLLMIGAAHQPPSSLNFFTRRNNQGEGVIVITSSRPMTDAELNIILKIQEGGASHLKHIRQPMRQIAKIPSVKNANEKSLTPKFIVSEKDIALNLPESTRFNVANTTPQPQGLKQEKLLNAPFALPPILETSKPAVTTTANSSAISIASTVKAGTMATATATPQPTTPVAEQTKPQPATAPLKQETTQATLPPTATKSSEALDTELKTTDLKTVALKEKDKAQNQVKQTVQSAKKKAPTSPASTPNNENNQQHIVQRNESLWSIAQRIAGQTHQPVSKVMNQIKAQNEHAFIGGNANRLRQGSNLNFNLAATTTQQNKSVNQIAAQTQGPAAGKAKYRLQQAEMSLVAESNQDSSTGSAKKDTLQQKTSADLSLKVMTAREKTVTLQRNVTQLELALRQKEQRIHLLNARLAELQDQLKAQQDTKKPTR